MIYINNKINNVVVVDVIKVFNEFKMKKELEAKVDVKLTEMSVKIDSLSGLLKLAAQSGDKAKYDAINKDLYVLQQNSQQAYDISNKNINKQVWDRLNPMIKEYGKEQGFRIIVGANGMGAVIYNESDIDKTTELIGYVNNRYENGN